MGYQIRVNCTCGKVLKIPEKYAGKRGRCPNCGKKITIPTIDEIEQKTAVPKENTEIRHCPTCGAYINPDDEVCVSCHMNLRTGEWDSDGRKGTVPTPSKLHYMGVAAVCVFLILGGISLLSRLYHEQPLSTLPENTIREKSGTVLERPVQQTSESTPIPTASPDPKAQAESAAEREYQEILQSTQNREDALRRWVKFREISTKYYGTDYMKKINEQGNPMAEAVKLIGDRKGTLQKALEEEKYVDVVAEGASWLGDIVSQSYPEQELQDEFAGYAKICREAALGCKPPESSPQPDPPREETELVAVKEKFAMYTRDTKGEWRSLESYYREKAKNWEFNQLISDIAPLAEKATTLSQKYEDADLGKILELYREGRILQQFWKCVEESVAALKDQKRTVNLILKGNQGVENGQIVQYRNGEIHIEVKVGADKKKTETKIYALKELSARGLTMLVRCAKGNSKKFHVTAACFSYINNDPYECRTHCDEAVNMGVSAEEIAKYQTWALGRVAEEEKVRAAKDLAKAQEIKTTQGGQDRQQHERMLKKAWDLIDKELLPAYKRDNTQEVFRLLKILQMTVPRDDLIKINGDLKNKEGKSLYDIADDTLKYCTYCKNSGKVKCNLCRGLGYLVDEKVLKYAKTESKRYCDPCGGSGEVYCSKCYYKRHNRGYCLIVDFYDEID